MCPPQRLKPTEKVGLLDLCFSHVPNPEPGKPARSDVSLFHEVQPRVSMSDRRTTRADSGGSCQVLSHSGR